MERPKSYINGRGTKIWYLPSKGKDYLHRLDGPAIEFIYGKKAWWVNNKRHRLDGPAIDCRTISTIETVKNSNERHVIGFENEQGSPIHFANQWWKNGKRHRLDGPAIEMPDGYNEWYVDGRDLWFYNDIETWIKENNIDLQTEEGQLALKLRWM